MDLLFGFLYRGDVIKDYDVVRLTRAFPEKGVAAGAQGTVLMTFDDPPGYIIEIVDSEGQTVAELDVRPDDVELVISYSDRFIIQRSRKYAPAKKGM